jgi:hypothetical protein
MADDATPPVKRRGGARPGAGRPCKIIDVAVDADPLVYLQALMTSKSSPEPLRLKAAIALASYKHAKPGAERELGKKEKSRLDAEEAVKSNSKFKPSRPPLAVVSRS